MQQGCGWLRITHGGHPAAELSPPAAKLMRAGRSRPLSKRACSSIPRCGRMRMVYRTHSSKFFSSPSWSKITLFESFKGLATTCRRLRLTQRSNIPFKGYAASCRSCSRTRVLTLHVPDANHLFKECQFAAAPDGWNPLDEPSDPPNHQRGIESSTERPSLPAPDDWSRLPAQLVVHPESTSRLRLRPRALCPQQERDAHVRRTYQDPAKTPKDVNGCPSANRHVQRGPPEHL